uniref:Aldehyde dehydrogenase family 2 member B7 n=1 Tax=Rhizophora mucronata TaxID=61149 RepID=A0A2P2K5W6_RHIMU
MAGKSCTCSWTIARNNIDNTFWKSSLMKQLDRIES